MTETAVRPVPRLTATRESPIWAAAVPRSVVSPWPSCPWALLPKHLMVLSSRRAHVKARPHAMEDTVRPVPRLMATREAPISPVASPMLPGDAVPVPSCPLSPRPQQTAAPLSSTAHV